MQQDGNNATSTKLERKIDALREDIANWNSVTKRITEWGINNLYSIDEVRRHNVYSFERLVDQHVENKSPNKTFFIYGSKLNFIQAGRENDQTPTSGLEFGLASGMSFRLSILSTLNDPIDTPHIEHLRFEGRKTLNDLCRVARRAERYRWEGSLLLSASPWLIRDSFSSIEIRSDRRVSVLKASPEPDSIHIVFDQCNSLESDLHSNLHTRYDQIYEQHTYPILSYGRDGDQISQETAKVGIILFDREGQVQLKDKKHRFTAELNWLNDYELNSVICERLNGQSVIQEIRPLLEINKIRRIRYAGKTVDNNSGTTYIVFCGLAEVNAEICRINIDDIFDRHDLEIRNFLSSYRRGIA